MRHLLIPVITLLLLTDCQPKQSSVLPILEEETSPLRNPEFAPFYHGVASGDPLVDRIIIWTRVTPRKKLPSIEVSWKVASDQSFLNVVQEGVFETTPERDYTVKVDVGGLRPGKRYYYRFHALDATSVIGKTKTASNDAESLSFGVVSCSNYEFGFFNGYASLAKEDLDAILHLGDYIYEYAPGTYGDTTLNRKHLPTREIVSLSDYRTRYSQYRLDPDLAKVHQVHPFITIWDDHEISNNSYQSGAQNHQPDEGDYETRKSIARQVYYEWMPIREDDVLYRTFNYGALADLIMLDERLAGRTQQADSLTDPSLIDPERSMLGPTQLSWFSDQLKSSKAQWKIIGNQVIYSYLDWGHPSFNINLDAWDGYPQEQQKVADLITSNEIENVVFVTGDTHTAWALEATNKPFDGYEQTTGNGAFAVEFGTTSINSGNSNERYPTEEVLAHEKRIVNSPINPHLKYTNMRDHGYMILTVNKEEAVAEWRFMETLRQRSAEVKEIKKISVKHGETKLNELAE